MNYIVTVSIIFFRSLYSALGSYGPGKPILVAHHYIHIDRFHFAFFTQNHSSKGHFRASG